MYLYEITLLSNVNVSVIHIHKVLYLYEITLLSNIAGARYDAAKVLYLYEITLLSNRDHQILGGFSVLYLYEITLLSNLKSQHAEKAVTGRRREIWYRVISTSILEFAQVNVNSNAAFHREPFSLCAVH